MQSLEGQIYNSSNQMRKYNLTCKVKLVQTTIATPKSDSRGNGSHYQGTLVILIPTKNTEFEKFMSAYYDKNIDIQQDVLPAGGSGDEFLAWFNHPVKSLGRICFNCEEKYCKDFHFIIMSEKVEEILTIHRIGTYITIEIQSVDKELDDTLEE